MPVIELKNKDGFVSEKQAYEAIGEFFLQNDYAGKRLLLIVPDNTRSGPVGDIFKIIYDFLKVAAKAVDVLVALGTHQPLTEEQICNRLTITPSERYSKYSQVKFFNHRWDKPETFTLIGRIPSEEIEQITGGLFREEVDVAINKLIFNYDEFFIIGPVFPHEVVGFSGGHKYIFPGIAGSEIINFFHWLSAVITIPAIIGSKWTPPREVIEKAASFVKMPGKLFAIVSIDNDLKGLFIGDCEDAWEKAADLSREVHIVYMDKPYHTILGLAPKMYEDIWTAAKVAYKLDPILADGGTLIIYAPHINEISYTHGKILDQIGYHTKDYFLKQMDKFTGIPRAAMAHSTHVKGLGTFIEGVERPRTNVVLATGIGKERCQKVTLGYMNPNEINIADYEGRENEGILLVRDAGETLYRLSKKSLA